MESKTAAAPMEMKRCERQVELGGEPRGQCALAAGHPGYCIADIPRELCDKQIFIDIPEGAEFPGLTAFHRQLGECQLPMDHEGPCESAILDTLNMQVQTGRFQTLQYSYAEAHHKAALAALETLTKLLTAADGSPMSQQQLDAAKVILSSAPSIMF